MNEVLTDSSESIEAGRNKQLLRVLFLAMGLNRVVRWQDQPDKKFLDKAELQDMRESVLEHVGGMGACITLILTEAAKRGDERITSLDQLKLSQCTLIHDAEEMFTGDLLVKDDTDKEKAEQAWVQIKSFLSESGFEDGENIIDEYKNKTTSEARFAKVIDDLQAMVRLVQARRFDMARSADAVEKSEGYKYSQEFPMLNKLFRLVLELIKRDTLIRSGVSDMPYAMGDES